MIQVDHLCKKFGSASAVDDISFEVKQGEVVGFLGPNGAGKTSTLRILAGYLAPTSGSVRVGGRCVTRDALEVRRRVGYLPENCPLYPELRVNEYLAFRARLKGIRRNVKNHVDSVRELCGLEDMGRRIIGQLSKGYRQRVGLADALVNEPDLLILDEPTIGLDPHQIKQVRELIRELGHHHTILLSTHILSEVEMLCERVLIIDGGRVVASDTPARLRKKMQKGSRITVECRAPGDAALRQLSALDRVRDVDVVGQGEWISLCIHCDAGSDMREAVYDCIRDQGWGLRELHADVDTLEDVFLLLTASGEEDHE